MNDCGEVTDHISIFGKEQSERVETIVQDTNTDCIASYEKKILVSRMGSGSHLMAMVLAKRENWDVSSLTYELVGNMEGAEKAMDSGSKGIFLWEKYTTAPMVEKGKMKRIGEIPSPWPCFVMVASEAALGEFGEVIFDLRNEIYRLSGKLSQSENLADLLALEYLLQPADVKQWLKQTTWCTEPVILKSVFEDSIQKMKDLKILGGDLELGDFLELGHLRVES
ncbi:MAG: hypothetical protein MUE75_13695 [Algoriphagus sp.]|nr:hypothetical protein [Algoriphagus sp.]